MSDTSSAPAAPTPTVMVSTACRYGPTRRVAELQDRTIREASGLVASRQWPGIYWTINDSGNDPVLYAFDEQGRARGTFRVNGANNVDWEALQLGPGRDGGVAIYIGDTGDNDDRRREAIIYRVPEPQPDPPSTGRTPPTRMTSPAEAFKLTFPSGPRDTEAMLVHPRTGEILLISKGTNDDSHVFRVPLPLANRSTTKLELITRVDLTFLGTRGHLITDASISADARRMAVRTYTHVLEWSLREDETLASVWSRAPRVSQIGDGSRGEGITYRPDGRALMSIGESVPALLYQSSSEC